MDINLEYPMSDYIRNIKRAVNAGDDVHVSITDPKLVKMIGKTLDELSVDEKSGASFFNFFGRWFRLGRFLTGHFYAVGAEYDFLHKKGDLLQVSYRIND